MPELPEVEALARFLRDQAGGKTIESLRVMSVAALKTFDPPLEAAHGLTVAGARRRGKFLVLDLGRLALVLHLARAGWVRWRDQVSAAPTRPGKGPMALRVRFHDGSGFETTEMGTEKRLAVYLVRSLDDVPGIPKLGIDPLDPAFTATELARLLTGNKGQIKGVLTDQAVIAGVGNAYSDEALHMAKLSPFRRAGSLTDDEVDRLHHAIVDVLRDAVERSVDLPAAGLKAEKRAGMRVHGRTGEPCPVCGDTVRQVAFSSRSLQYCAACQTGGKPLADRRLSRLLK